MKGLSRGSDFGGIGGLEVGWGCQDESETLSRLDAAMRWGARKAELEEKGKGKFTYSYSDHSQVTFR